MDTSSPLAERGLLAGSPADLANPGAVVRYGESEHLGPFFITNRGLCIRLGLRKIEENIYLATLDCPVPPGYEEYVGICLKRLSTTTHQYARVYPHKLVPTEQRGNLYTIYVRRRTYLPVEDPISNDYFHLRKGPARKQGYELTRTITAPSSSGSLLEIFSSAPQWAPEGAAFYIQVLQKVRTLAAVLTFQNKGGKDFLLVMLGTALNSGIGIDAICHSNSSSSPIIFNELEKMFNSQAPGSYLLLEEDRVRVGIETQIRGGVKEHMVDIEILRTPKEASEIGIFRLETNETTEA